jgi:hypothetical protein
MEPRFRADFRGVRVHTGDQAARLNRRLHAQAFTVGNQIFFGSNRFQPDTHGGRRLIAHELTHTIQQGAAVQQEPVQRAAEPAVSSTAEPHVQRGIFDFLPGVDTVLNALSDLANNIPGWRMFTIVLGTNPITGQPVDRGAANILRAVVELMPGGALITQVLDRYGVFDRAGAWIEGQIASLGLSGAALRSSLMQFLHSLDPTDFLNPGAVWDRARRIFSEPIDRLTTFARNLITGILRLVREAVLSPLARLAQGTCGWDLLKAVLGEDPITGEAVPRNAETLIGGFMRLIGQEEIWQNIQSSHAIPRAWAWFQGALGSLLGFVRQLPDLFVAALEALEITDFLILPRAFMRVAAVFGDFAERFFTWAGGAIWNLLEIIFEVVAPQVMVYLRRAASAFRTILRDPIGFVRNLIRAVLGGLRQFATNFLTHLRTSIIGWLTGAMAGASIYIPQAFTIQEIIKFVLSVLGLTWANIRQKLVRVIGETAVTVLERGFEIVVTLVTQGPAAAWEKIKENLADLREMVMGQIMNFVSTNIVQAAITRLVTSLNPAGAFVQAVIAIYNTVMFLTERIRQIAQVAARVIDTIASIAAGQVQPSSDGVERTMAGLLTLVISFLARILGLGRVTDAVTNIINRVRAPIDRALDKVIDWIVATARRLGRMVAQAGVPQDPNERLRLGMAAALAATNRFAGRPTARPLLETLLGAIKVRFGFQILEPRPNGRKWSLFGAVNPTKGVDTDVDVPGIIPLNPITPPEEARIRPIPGGPQQLAELARRLANPRATPQDIAGVVGGIRTALQLLGSGVAIAYFGLEVRNARTLKTVTEIDVLTADAMIEVKTADYSAVDKLSGDDMTQFARLRQIFKGTLRVLDPAGAPFVPPRRWVYQFTRPISPTLYRWLRDRDVTEVRIAV